MEPEQPQERYQPLALIGVALIALVGFAVFFLSFLVAPLAILLIFYVGFAASDRSKRGKAQAQAQAQAQADEPVVVAPVAAAPVDPEARDAHYRRQSQDRRGLESSHDPRPPR